MKRPYKTDSIPKGNAFGRSTMDLMLPKFGRAFGSNTNGMETSTRLSSWRKKDLSTRIYVYYCLS